MKNTEKWIAIAFLAFILVIPAVTLVQNLMPQSEGQLTQQEQAILENNGTSAGQNRTEESETQTADASQPAQEAGFTKLQNKINHFTDNLFCRSQLIAFNAKLTSLLTGGTYIEST